MGHLVTKEGLKPHPDKIEAVQEMQKQDNIKAIRRFCGFVKYLVKFLPKLSEVTGPVRNFTCKENEWGLGTALLQKVEKELLAVVFALDKFEQYTYGRSVMIESDPQPLEVIAKKQLRYATKRLQGIHVSQDLEV